VTGPDQGFPLGLPRVSPRPHTEALGTRLRVGRKIGSVGNRNHRYFFYAQGTVYFQLLYDELEKTLKIVHRSIKTNIDVAQNAK
jgi:hypothetical protein